MAAVTMKLLFLATAANALRAPTSMSVAVFGATGLTGRECTHQLLERGVRSCRAVPVQRLRLAFHHGPTRIELALGAVVRLHSRCLLHPAVGTAASVRRRSKFEAKRAI